MEGGNKKKAKEGRERMRKRWKWNDGERKERGDKNEGKKAKEGKEKMRKR